MKDGFQVDNFIWKFDVREDDQIMISSSSEYLKQLKAYEASDTMFSISTLTDDFWYAGTEAYGDVIDGGAGADAGADIGQHHRQ